MLRTRPSAGRHTFWAAIIIVAGAGGLLWAQSSDGPSPTETIAATPQSPTTQPASAAERADNPPPEINPEQAEQIAARNRLLSGLIGSKHDFTEQGKSGRDLCLPCHTPHLLDPPTPTLDDRPSQTKPLRPYRTAHEELDGWSLLCFGCHDGITASDVYSSAHATTVADQFGNSRLATRGLRSHPVGIRYPTGNPDYHPGKLVEEGGLPLPGGRIQCATCHDAHNTHQYGGMMRISNERSQLCLTCHRL